MSDKKKILLDLAEKKEINYSVTKIKRTKLEDIDTIWNEVQKERLSETNVFIAESFVDKLCDILESTNVIESGVETSTRLKNRKAFMSDMQNIAGYFSSLIPYIGILEGGVVLGKDVYDNKICSPFKNKNETPFETEKRSESSEADETDFVEQDM